MVLCGLRRLGLVQWSRRSWAPAARQDERTLNAEEGPLGPSVWQPSPRPHSGPGPRQPGSQGRLPVPGLNRAAVLSSVFGGTQALLCTPHLPPRLQEKPLGGWDTADWPPRSVWRGLCGDLRGEAWKEKGVVHPAPLQAGASPSHQGLPSGIAPVTENSPPASRSCSLARSRGTPA